MILIFRVFCNVIPCSLVHIYQRFGRTCHLQGLLFYPEDGGSSPIENTFRYILGTVEPLNKTVILGSLVFASNAGSAIPAQ